MARRFTLIATSLGFAVVQLDVSVVNVAIKPIGTALGTGVGSLQWVVNAYTFTFAALILAAGALGDRLGAKRVFVSGFALFTAASAACGLAPTLGALIAARAVQGVGAAVLVPCSLAVLNHTFPEPRERVRAIGLWAAGASTALSAGPLLGGALTAAFGWRAIFFINAPLGAAAIALTLRFATETPRSRQTMLPTALLRSRTFSSATAIGLLLNIAFYGLVFGFSLFFEHAQHLSPLEAGCAFAPMTFSVLAANLLAGRVAERLGRRATIVIGGLLMASGAAALEFAGGGTAYAAMVVQLAALGFGIGLVVPVMTSALLGSVDAARSGVASGTLNTARQTGSVIGVALYGSLLGGGIVSGLHAGLAVSCGLALLVAALTVGLKPEESPG